MKLSLPIALSALALGALVMTSLTFARQDRVAAAAAPTTATTWTTSDLESSMQLLQGTIKKVDKALEKGDLAEVAKLAVDMGKVAAEAKLGTPEKAATITGTKEKAEFLLGYRKQMILLQRALLDLEVLALDGKTEDAKKYFNESVKPMKKEGHGKYKD